MPATENLLYKYIKEIRSQLGEIKDAWPIDKAMKTIRHILHDNQHFKKVRVATTVYLLQILLLHDPKIITVIETLNHKSLDFSQAEIIQALSELLSSPGQGQTAILVAKKSNDGDKKGDRIALSQRIIKKIND